MAYVASSEGDKVLKPLQTKVSTNPFAASMSSANFENPWDFAPDRWTANQSDDLLDASQPFSVGPRACLGRTWVLILHCTLNLTYADKHPHSRLAWMELHMILAKMHFMYDLELVDLGVDWQRDSEMHLLWKKPPLLTKVHRRHGVSCG